MKEIYDYKNRVIRFTAERKEHLYESHPEMINQENKILETLKNPECVIKSRSDETVELFYRFFEKTPVKSKYLCVVVKLITGDNFIITSYFTDTIKKGTMLWKKK